MENLFNFSYELNNLKNANGTNSRFFSVQGDNGNIIHCKKDSYELVSTESLSLIGNAFIDDGNNVNTFVHRDGEVIGLNILLGEKATKVGDKQYNALITVPNNGSGKGFLQIKENRLVCTNGLVHTMSQHTDTNIKIPHNFDYHNALDLMHKSIISFQNLISDIEVKEEALLGIKLKETDVMFLLNKWFYDMEMPMSHKDGISFNDFRLFLVDDTDKIKCYERYEQLMKAFREETQHNSLLKLELSKYTVIATITDYLSRRIEQSNSGASNEIQFARQSEKVNGFEKSILAY